MECQQCHVQKLSKEFPPSKLTEKCFHPSAYCIRCVLQHWEEHKQCLHCETPIEESSYALKECLYVLKKLFPEVTKKQESDDDDDDDDNEAIPHQYDAADGYSKQTITITDITGEVLEMDFHPSMTVLDLQEEIAKRTEIPKEQQDLRFNNQRLEIYTESHRKLNVLGDDYGVGPNSNIYLMKLVKALDPHLKNVTFHINWSHKKYSRIFLDLTIDCFRNIGQECVESINHVTSECAGIVHSGDKIDDDENTGAQEAKIALHDVSENIDYIFFTLSRYNAKGIPDNLEFQFYEKSKRDKKLYTESIQREHDQQAIVLCALVRDETGHWLVYSYNKPCNGHIKDYKSVITTIQDIIKEQSTSDALELPRVEYEPTKLGRMNRAEISVKRIVKGMIR